MSRACATSSAMGVFWKKERVEGWDAWQLQWRFESFTYSNSRKTTRHDARNRLLVGVYNNHGTYYRQLRRRFAPDRNLLYRMNRFSPSPLISTAVPFQFVSYPFLTLLLVSIESSARFCTEFRIEAGCLALFSTDQSRASPTLTNTQTVRPIHFIDFWN